MSSEWIITVILLAVPVTGAAITIVRDFRTERRRRELRRKSKGDGMP